MLNSNKSIIVYDKKGEQQAIFSNDNSVHTEQAKFNLLNNPIVHLVMNGESTLSFSMFEKSTKWQQVKNPEYEWHCDGRVYTMLSENSVTYQGDLVLVTLYESWILLGKQYAQIYNVDRDVEKNIDIHTIMILPKSDSKFKLTVNGTAYEDSEVKDSRGELLPRGSAGYALWALLKANRYGWTIGVCDVIVDGFDPTIDFGTFNLETDQKTLLENIQSVQALWGGVLVWDSKNKIIHLRDETKQDSDFNTWKGFIASYNKNMTEKPQIKVDNNIITRAYPLGQNNLSIKQINDNKEYIENFSYTDKVYEAYIYNSNIYYTGDASTSGQTQLKAWAERELAKLCKPRETYLFTIVDRSFQKEFSHEKFDFLDVIQMDFINQATGEQTFLEQRIIDLSYDVFSDSEKSVFTGDKIANDRDIWRLVYKNANSQPLPNDSNQIGGNNIIVDLDDETAELLDGQNRQNLLQLTENELLLMAKYKDQTMAAITIVANDLESYIQLFTLFQEETEQGFIESAAAITLVSNELEAQILLEASHYEELNGEIQGAYAAIEIIATDIDARITAQVETAFGHGFLEITDNSAIIGASSGWSFGRLVIDSSSVDLTATNSKLNLSSEQTITIACGTGDINIDAQSSLGSVNIDAGRDIRVYGSNSLRLGGGELYIQNSRAYWSTITVGEETYTVLMS